MKCRNALRDKFKHSKFSDFCLSDYCSVFTWIHNCCCRIRSCSRQNLLETWNYLLLRCIASNRHREYRVTHCSLAAWDFRRGARPRRGLRLIQAALLLVASFDCLNKFADSKATCLLFTELTTIRTMWLGRFDLKFELTSRCNTVAASNQCLQAQNAVHWMSFLVESSPELSCLWLACGSRCLYS